MLASRALAPAATTNLGKSLKSYGTNWQAGKVRVRVRVRVRERASEPESKGKYENRRARAREPASQPARVRDVDAD